MDFSTVLKKFVVAHFPKGDKGDKFERLIANWLLTDPAMPASSAKCGCGPISRTRRPYGNDTGIDLVARTIEGDYWAIQCKCYEKGHRHHQSHGRYLHLHLRRQFPDVDTLQTTHFACCLWVSTSDVFGRNASESTSGQSIPFCRIGFGDLANSAVDWQKLWDGLNGAQAALPCKQPMEHQTIAVNKAMDYFALARPWQSSSWPAAPARPTPHWRLPRPWPAATGWCCSWCPASPCWDSRSTHGAPMPASTSPPSVSAPTTPPTDARNGADAADADERTFDLAYPASTDADNIARQLIRIKDEDGPRWCSPPISLWWRWARPSRKCWGSPPTSLACSASLLRWGSPHHRHQVGGRLRRIRIYQDTQQRCGAGRQAPLHDRHSRPTRVPQWSRPRRTTACSAPWTMPPFMARSSSASISATPCSTISSPTTRCWCSPSARATSRRRWRASWRMWTARKSMPTRPPSLWA